MGRRSDARRALEAALTGNKLRERTFAGGKPAIHLVPEADIVIAKKERPPKKNREKKGKRVEEALDPIPAPYFRNYRRAVSGSR